VVSVGAAKVAGVKGKEKWSNKEEKRGKKIVTKRNSEERWVGEVQRKAS